MKTYFLIPIFFVLVASISAHAIPLASHYEGSNVDVYIKPSSPGSRLNHSYVAMVVFNKGKNSALYRLETRGQEWVWLPVYIQKVDYILAYSYEQPVYISHLEDGGKTMKIVLQDYGRNTLKCSQDLTVERSDSGSTWSDIALAQGTFSGDASRVTLTPSGSGQNSSGRYYFPKINKEVDVEFRGNFLIDPSVAGLGLLRSLEYSPTTADGIKAREIAAGVVSRIIDDGDDKLLVFYMPLQHGIACSWRTSYMEKD